MFDVLVENIPAQPRQFIPARYTRRRADTDYLEEDTGKNYEIVCYIGGWAVFFLSGYIFLVLCYFIMPAEDNSLGILLLVISGHWIATFIAITGIAISNKRSRQTDKAISMAWKALFIPSPCWIASLPMMIEFHTKHANHLEMQIQICLWLNSIFFTIVGVCAALFFIVGAITRLVMFLKKRLPFKIRQTTNRCMELLKANSDTEVIPNKVFEAYLNYANSSLKTRTFDKLFLFSVYGFVLRSKQGLPRKLLRPTDLLLSNQREVQEKFIALQNKPDLNGCSICGSDLHLGELVAKFPACVNLNHLKCLNHHFRKQDFCPCCKTSLRKALTEDAESRLRPI